MPGMGWLLLLFIAVPAAEIWLLIKIGGAIGPFPTLFAVVLSGILGAGLARWQSASVQARMRGEHSREPPTRAILENLLIFVAGVLLITPGVLTDLAGLALLVPSARRKVADRVREKMTAQATGGGGVNVFTFGARPPDGPGAPSSRGGVRDLSPDDYEVSDTPSDGEAADAGPRRLDD